MATATLLKRRRDEQRWRRCIGTSVVAVADGCLSQPCSRGFAVRAAFASTLAPQPHTSAPVADFATSSSPGSTAFFVSLNVEMMYYHEQGLAAVHAADAHCDFTQFMISIDCVAISRWVCTSRLCGDSVTVAKYPGRPCAHAGVGSLPASVCTVRLNTRQGLAILFVESDRV